MGYIIVIAIVAFLVGVVAGYAIAPALKKQNEIDQQIEEFVESDGSCEDNDEQSQLKSAQVNNDKFEIGDIVMKDFSIENPFAQDSCMLITNKQRNEKGVMYYEYMFCDRDGRSTGMLRYGDTLDRCTKVGHKN